MGFDRTALPQIADYLSERGLTLTGPRASKWRTTRCEFHSGSDSMRVNVISGGWCCMACGQHGGDALAYAMQADSLDFIEAAKQLGCWIEDNKPYTAPRRPAGLRPLDALEVLSFEAMVCAMVTSDAAHGKPISDVDKDRALQAVGRIQQLVQEVTS